MTQSVMRLMHSTSPEGSNSWRTSSLVVVYVRFSITKRVTPLRVMSCALAKSCVSSKCHKTHRLGAYRGDSAIPGNPTGALSLPWDEGQQEYRGREAACVWAWDALTTKWPGSVCRCGRHGS
jgi:hypothetical protein